MLFLNNQFHIRLRVCDWLQKIISCRIRGHQNFRRRFSLATSPPLDICGDGFGEDSLISRVYPLITYINIICDKLRSQSWVLTCLPYIDYRSRTPRTEKSRA